MKKSIILSISILFFVSAYPQTPVPTDSIYDVIKKSSIHSKNANWTNIGDGFAKRLKAAKNDIDSIKSFVYVFEQLNDYHSAVIYKGNYFTNYPTFDDSTLKYLSPLVALSNQRSGKFFAETLSDKYLYIQVNSVQAMGANISLFAQILSDTLSRYITNKTKGVVLDLRLNGGGQFSSMVAGLSPLLGDIYIGGGVNSDSIQTMTFKLKNGNIFLNDYQMTSIQPKINRDLKNLPVAVIIGPATRSSGSILGIAFKGRPKTVFIGENTANGYTTSNDYFPFGNNLFLNLSTTNSIDRNNKIYKDVVTPDIIIKGGDNFISIKDDDKVKAALRWLKSNSR